MKKTLILAFMVFIIMVTLLFSNEIINSIKFSFNLCFNNLFPSLIPFMLFSNIILNYDIVDDLNELFNFLMKKFKVNKNVSFIFIMSIFGGTPSNATYISNCLNKKLITENDANKCLNFCHFLNPIFIISTVGYQFLGSKTIGLKILFSHYISNIILGILSRNKNFECTNDKITEKNKENIKKLNFFIILKNSILNISSTLVLMLGIITFFIIVTTLLSNIINISKNYKFIFGLLEITQGLKYLSYSSLNLISKTIISSFLISFGGICIHLQTFCIIDNKKVRYSSYLLTRLIHGLISSIISLLIIGY